MRDPGSGSRAVAGVGFIKTTETTMKLILDTHCTPPECNGDCDYAVLDVTPELLELVRRRMEAAGAAYQKDNDLFEIYFWDYRLDFYDSSLIDACQEAIAPTKMASAEEVAKTGIDRLETSGYAELPAGVDLAAFTPQRTECDQMVVRHCSTDKGWPVFEIAWIVIPKHTDSYVVTHGLSLTVLESYCDDKPASTKESQQ